MLGSEPTRVKIESNDLLAAAPKIDETLIVLQRHGAYERAIGTPETGKLTEAGEKQIQTIVNTSLQNIFSENSKESWPEIDILVVGSDTQYYGGGKRSIETADIALNEIKKKLSELNLNQDQLLNLSGNFKQEEGTGVRPFAHLREPKILDNAGDEEKMDNFLKFLREQYGEGPNGSALSIPGFVAFEEDIHKDKRDELKSEGPDDIVKRTMHGIKVLSRFARMYHKKHNGRRLVVWVATHYDTISPTVKRKVMDAELTDIVNVDYGAGISLNLDKDGNCTTTLKGKKYTVDAQ